MNHLIRKYSNQALVPLKSNLQIEHGTMLTRTLRTLVRPCVGRTGLVSHRAAISRSKHKHRTYSSLSEEQLELLNSERPVDVADVCIVGGGPAGLATAIKLKQMDQTGDLRVVLLEKSADFGNHIVSGAVIEPEAFKELFPEDESPIPEDMYTPVTEESFKFLIDDYALPLPKPPLIVNKGKNVIVSLNQLVKHLSERAEELGVELYSGISVSDIVFDESGKSVKGIATKDIGMDKNQQLNEEIFEKGMEFHSKVTVFAEGCHGSLTKQLIKKYDLRANSDEQTYGLGIKEVWQVPDKDFKKGYVTHSLGYPLNNNGYGGGFMYHFGDNMVAVGLVIGLDYKNPWINPYKEFQLMKHHPFYAQHLKNGKVISYGARALNEGGLQSVPKLYFPGGILVGDCAGFLNITKVKGTHNAVRSGILAAEQVYAEIKDMKMAGSEDVDEENAHETLPETAISLSSYERSFRGSKIFEELNAVRNIRPAFNTPFGVYLGMAWSGIESLFLKGRLDYTLHIKETDSAATGLADEHEKIEYPKPDNKISFDLMASVSRTGTYHREGEMSHLRVKDNTAADLQDHLEKAYPKYKGVEARFCPAGVYEYVEDNGKLKFQINSQNCIHCKTCDIKVPTQDITWTVPEGGEGPKYFMT